MSKVGVNLTRAQFEFLLRKIIDNDPMPCQFDLWIKKNIDTEDKYKTVNIFVVSGTKDEIMELVNMIVEIEENSDQTECYGCGQVTDNPQGLCDECKTRDDIV